MFWSPESMKIDKHTCSQNAEEAKIDIRVCFYVPRNGHICMKLININATNPEKKVFFCFRKAMFFEKWGIWALFITTTHLNHASLPFVNHAPQSLSWVLGDSCVSFWGGFLKSVIFQLSGEALHLAMPKPTTKPASKTMPKKTPAKKTAKASVAAAESAKFFNMPWALTDKYDIVVNNIDKEGNSQFVSLGKLYDKPAYRGSYKCSTPSGGKKDVEALLVVCDKFPNEKFVLRRNLCAAAHGSTDYQNLSVSSWCQGASSQVSLREWTGLININCFKLFCCIFPDMRKTINTSCSVGRRSG